ncbi:MAG: Swarming motility protein SwrC [Paenibacillus sp.]|nr:Swarming motility protein SwrC [Paenibacillus sp.]
MKSIIRFSLGNKFAILILTLIVTAAGLYAGLTMKKETIPDIEVPVLTVTAIYPGAAPQEVADKLAKPLELRIRALAGVGTVSSTSMENAASIMIEYGYDKNMKEAEDELRRVLADFVKPEGVQDIRVSKISINDFPVISLSVSGKTKQLEEVTRLVQDELRPMLEGIDGAGSVSISGQYVQEVELTFDRAKMAELGIGEETVKAIVQGSAIQVPLGLFEMENAEKTVVVDGNIRTLDDLRNLSIPVIPSAAGSAAGAAAAPGAAAMPGAAAAPGTAVALGAPQQPNAAPGASWSARRSRSPARTAANRSALT